MRAGGIIQSETSESEHASTQPFLPSNVVIMGVGKEKIANIEHEALDYPDPIPEDCEIVRKASDYSPHKTPPRAWLHSFESSEFVPSSAVELHPDLFASHPRMDFLYDCKEWQEKYREVDYSWAPTRAEMGRGKKKPWPQKGTGRARHGSRVGPQWKGGGIANGPRGPRALFRKINPVVRLGALTSALTIKQVQNRLLIVKDFSIPSPELQSFKKILAENQIVDETALLVFANSEHTDESSNVFSAVAECSKVNIMPLVALNVWSMLHHDWLVLTCSALDDLERKVTWHLQRYNWIDKPHNFYRDLPFEVRDTTQWLSDHEK